MDLRLVEYFVAVIDHGGITKAANALYIAQPSLSLAIKSLERDLGAELFDRSGRTLNLTDAGRALEVSARRVLDDLAIARDRVEEVRALRAGRLHIAAAADLALHPLPGFVASFRAHHPQITVHVSDPSGAGQTVAAVRRGEVEIGFATLPIKAPAMTVVPLDAQPMVLVSSPELAEELPDPVPQHLLAGLPLIRSAEDRLADLLIMPDLLPPASDAMVRSGFRQVTWDLVMAGAGMAVVPHGIATTQLAGVVVRPLAPELIRPIGMVFRTNQLSPAATAFLELLPRAGVALPTTGVTPG